MTLRICCRFHPHQCITFRTRILRLKRFYIVDFLIYCEPNQNHASKGMTKNLKILVNDGHPLLVKLQLSMRFATKIIIRQLIKNLAVWKWVTTNLVITEANIKKNFVRGILQVIDLVKTIKLKEQRRTSE